MIALTIARQRNPSLSWRTEVSMRCLSQKKYKRLNRDEKYMKKNNVQHLLLAPLTRVLEDRPSNPLLWFAQYFFLRSLKVQNIHFQERSSNESDEGAHEESSLPGMDGQVVKFTDHANVILYGTKPRSPGASDSGPAYTRESLEQSIDAAVTGLLLYRPANVCAWLAIEFCRQSPRVDFVSWSGRAINTSQSSGPVEEQSARHRRARQPRAESPPPFSPRTIRKRD
eukprot:INCI6546.2.p1 GENE.INCI6546.2~~INCI6546.2.p1  ORF type:complete len:226 (+),score=22.80 INCI6546.2:311-988(+)